MNKNYIICSNKCKHLHIFYYNNITTSGQCTKYDRILSTTIKDKMIYCIKCRECINLTEDKKDE